MALWSDWTPEIATDVPGCPEPMIENAVREAVIDFCQRTRWLTSVNTTAADVTGGATLRTFATPLLASGSRVLEVKGAWYQGKALEVWTPQEAEEVFGPLWSALTGEPRAIVLDRLDAYYVVPSPAATVVAALTMRLATAPLPSATACDDTLRFRWREAIRDGAIARLAIMPGKVWTNEGRAAIGGAALARAIGSAQTAAARGAAKRRLQVPSVFY